MTKVYMTLDGSNIFLATEVYTLQEQITSEAPEDQSRSWLTFVHQEYTSIGFLVEFELPDGTWDISHGRVFKKEALMRKAFCLGEL